MPTYVYETMPSEGGQPVKRFEVNQSMKDAPLKKHPETGEPVQRVISGGFGFLPSGGDRSEPSGGSCCNSSGCGCG